MFEPGSGTAIAGELAEARDELVSIRQRVIEAAGRAPRREASGWSGPAALAYQHALDGLSRELAVACELLRSAVDLASAAVWEVNDHG